MQIFKEERGSRIYAVEVSEIDGEKIERLYAFGYAQYTSGNWPKAADIFRSLCTTRPLESRFWFALGASLQGGSFYREALPSWAMAALLKDKDPYPHYHAAECYLSLKKVQEAQKALEEAFSRLPEKGHPLEGKIALLKKQWENYG